MFSRLLVWDPTAAIFGVVAAVISFAVTTSPPFALVIGLVVYWGVINVKATRSGTGVTTVADAAERVDLSLETSSQKIAGMRALLPQIDRESTREIVQRICDQSDEVVALMRGDSKKAQLAPSYLEQLLEPAEAMLETYVRLRARGVLQANDLILQTERQDLPMIERASRLFRDQLASNDGVDRKNLEQILAFNVESPTAIVEPRRDR